MISIEDLEKVYGQAGGQNRFKYLRNKNTGGRNNSKGNTFENFYAVFKIAQLINDNLAGQARISSQLSCFVDDLIIERLDKNMAQFYQIKDVDRLTWRSGSSFKIEDDFAMQKAVGDEITLGTKTYLVVSKKDVQKNLKKNFPASISHHTEIVFFPAAPTINHMLQVNPGFRSILVDICAINNPNSDKLEAIAAIILGVWDGGSKEKVSVEDIVNGCFLMNPNFLKRHAGQLLKNIESIFMSVKGFSYKVEHGFISWNYLLTDSGVFQHPIGSPQFIQWENDIMKLTITTFDELEPYLS